MWGGFKASKLKPQLKMAVSRFQIASNKKSAILKQQMREIAALLAEEPQPKEEKARIRAESLIREDNTIEAYEILQLECELLHERIKLISSCKDCPADLVSCVSTLMWATDRVDIPELVEIRKQFRSKYGKKFEENAMNNVNGCLNERVVAKLSVEPPSAYLVQTYLERIAEEHGIDWKPQMTLNAESASLPMVAPIGTSVPMAPGTGLAPPVTGQEPFEKGDYYAPGPSVPAPTVTPIPIPPPATEEEDEPDIFVPAPPTNPVNGSVGGSGHGGSSIGGGIPPPVPFVPYVPPENGNKKDDDDGEDGDPTNGANGASYDDLAARFAALQR